MENPFDLILREFKSLEASIEGLRGSLHPPAAATLPAEQIYTKAEAAELLCITEATLSGYVQERKIPYCKPTEGRVYFLHSDLIDWLRTHRRATLAEQLAGYEQISTRHRRTNPKPS